MYKISSWDINNEIIWKMKTILGKELKKCDKVYFFIFSQTPCVFPMPGYFIFILLKYLTPELHWEIAFPFLTGPGDTLWNSTRQSFLQTTMQETGNTNNTCGKWLHTDFQLILKEDWNVAQLTSAHSLQCEALRVPCLCKVFYTCAWKKNASKENNSITAETQKILSGVCVLQKEKSQRMKEKSDFGWGYLFGFFRLWFWGFCFIVVCFVCSKLIGFVVWVFLFCYMFLKDFHFIFFFWMSYMLII